MFLFEPDLFLKNKENLHLAVGRSFHSVQFIKSYGPGLTCRPLITSAWIALLIHTRICVLLAYGYAIKPIAVRGVARVGLYSQ